MPDPQANFALEAASPEAAFAVRSWSGRATYLAGERVACDSSDGGEEQEIKEDLPPEEESSHCEEVTDEEMRCVSLAQQKHRIFLETMAAERAALTEQQRQKQEREALRRARKTQKLAARAARRAAARRKSEPQVSSSACSSADDRTATEAAEEAARVERVRMTRKRQKERYKRLLQELAKKRSQQDEAVKIEDDRRRRKKIVNKRTPPRNQSAVVANPARGSGIRAARAAQQKKDEYYSGDDEASAARRLECNRLVREKQKQHLSRLVAERKQREIAEAANVQRLARRQRLCTERMLAEIFEKKRSVSSSSACAEAPAAAAKPEVSSGDEREDGGGRRLSAEAQRAMIERLNSTRTETKGDTPVAARDFADWKRKRGIAPDKKVFVMTGWYPCVKDALVARGWVHNPDRESPFFDLKWTLTSQHLRKSVLQPWQFANHFQKTRSLVTKVGLSQSLASLQWFARETCDAIFPRCYDLSNAAETRAFVEDFQSLEAARVLQAIVRVANRDTGAAAIVNAEVCSAALTLCRQLRSALQSEDIDIVPYQRGGEQDALFELMALVSDRLVDSAGDDRAVLASSYELPIEPPPPRFPIEDDGSSSSNDHPKTVGSAEAARRESFRTRQAAQRNAKARERVIHNAALEPQPLDEDFLLNAREILEDLGRQLPQAGIDGLHRDGSLLQNLWMVKPAAKSRGRGIATFRSLQALFEYCDMTHKQPKPGGSMWIVQKYIENQLLIANRKFDLRQWVLVTKWNPLTIWFYDECYARFSAAEFTTKHDDLRNEYVHLVNNSVSKKSCAFHDRVFAENGDEIVDCMWTLQQFRDYLTWRHNEEPFPESKTIGRRVVDTPRDQESRSCKQVFCKTTGVDGGDDFFAASVQPAMQHIATCALLCAQDSVEPRSNSWELFGFDFMLDDSGKPWLIEINSSPACDYSTAVTESFVQRALVDILKVTFDHAEWSSAQSSHPPPDTGGWKQIYVGPMIETPVSSFGGADILCRGALIPEPREFRRARRASQHSYSLSQQRQRVSSNFEKSEMSLAPESLAPAPPTSAPRTKVLVEGPAVPLLHNEQIPMPPQKPSRKPPAPGYMRRSGGGGVKKNQLPVAQVRITTVTMDL